MVYLVQIMDTYVFKHCPATGMKIGDEASPSIILAARALLVKMLITVEPHCIFCSNFVYLCILTLSSHWYLNVEPSSSIIFAGRALLVKMLITL